MSLSIVDFFLRFPSVTQHSTSSSLQFVHGMPLSTTSQRTFLERQHWQALEARLFTDRFPDVKPAAVDFLLGAVAEVGCTGCGIATAAAAMVSTVQQ